MPRRDRPAQTQRSEHWLRVAVNDRTAALDTRVRNQFCWCYGEQIEWLLPVRADAYAEFLSGKYAQLLPKNPHLLHVRIHHRVIQVPRRSRPENLLRHITAILGN